ncbi:MAG TPA: hypothetical protein VFU47_13700 [Armatimonadota bacterium]|nr:hypothetical protein [Armatimonadota bacterium]
MKPQFPLWLALAGCLGALALGHGWAQGQQEKKPDEPPALTEYPYLPNRYGEPYIPSVAEWQALRLTALGASTTRITEQFSRQHLTCFPTPKGLVLTLDLLPQPEWKHYAGNGKFSAPPATVRPDLQQAVDVTMRFVRNFFPEVRDQDVTIRLFIRSENVGAWEAGKLTLSGERSE